MIHPIKQPSGLLQGDNEMSERHELGMAQAESRHSAWSAACSDDITSSAMNCISTAIPAAVLSSSLAAAIPGTTSAWLEGVLAVGRLRAG
jgi:hypothetical protein